MTYLEIKNQLKELKKTRKVLAGNIKYLETAQQLSFVIGIGTEIVREENCNDFELQRPEVVLNDTSHIENYTACEEVKYSLIKYFKAEYEFVSIKILELKKLKATLVSKLLINH